MSLSTEKPILFNTEMVKAILDGRKTQTRRVIGNRFRITEFIPFNEEEKQEGYRFSIIDEKTNSKYDTVSLDFFTTYGFSNYKVGDILYVRETFQTCECDICEVCNVLDGIVYKADYNIKGEHPDLYTCLEDEMYWKPSIFMPKKYARIFLKVTNVKVERLQDISLEDMLKEGINHIQSYNSGNVIKPSTQIKREFISLWNSTLKFHNGVRKSQNDLNTYSWEDNPYVFVYEFERINYERFS